MNAMQVFNYGYRAIRTVEKDGQIWFVAKDVCNVLELTNITETLRRVDEPDLSEADINSSGQSRKMKMVSESGMYAIIFQSNKPQAIAFKRWVTSEVLPTLRKTGSYQILTPQQKERLDRENLWHAREVGLKHNGLIFPFILSLQHTFLMRSSWVARGLACHPRYVASARIKYKSDLFYGVHYFFASGNISTINSRQIDTATIFWTKRGLIRLCFLINGFRSGNFCDWIEGIEREHFSDTRPVPSFSKQMEYSDRVYQIMK